LGKYLHDLGVVLWYHDIARIWAAPAYARMHDELLALMQAFRLCYKKTQRDAYIIPSMLRPDADFDWEERDNVRLYYEYEFMPKGLVNQLTAELHRLIPDDEQVWRSGVVFERDGTEVKVEEIRNDKRLTFHAKGLMPGALLQEVAGRLEDLHLGYPGIEVEKVVPCPCVECKDSKEPETYKYSKLIRWIQKGKKTVHCNESEKDLDIYEILGHVGISISKATFDESWQRHKGNKPPPTFLNIFISYSKKDKELCDKLQTTLFPLKNLNPKKKTQIWHDREIIAGEIWNDKIKSELRNADIVLCLVSSDFLATKYIIDEELPIILEREQQGLTKVIPVILRPCPWQDTILAKFQALLGKDTPLTLYDDQDSAFMEIYKGLKRVIET